MTAVDLEARRVEINHGVNISDLLGNPLKNPQGEYEVPGLNFAVKRQRNRSFPNGGIDTEETELVSLRQAG